MFIVEQVSSSTALNEHKVELHKYNTVVRWRTFGCDSWTRVHVARVYIIKIVIWRMPYRNQPCTKLQFNNTVHTACLLQCYCTVRFSIRVQFVRWHRNESVHRGTVLVCLGNRNVAHFFQQKPEPPEQIKRENRNTDDGPIGAFTNLSTPQKKSLHPEPKQLLSENPAES